MNNEKSSFAKGFLRRQGFGGQVGRARENIIISLGGSIVMPDDIDTAFLKVFKNIIKKYLNPNHSTSLRARRFFIFVGGGRVARNYQKALLEFGADNKERDLIGIDVSRLNARIVKQSFGELVYSEIITNPTKRINTKKDIVKIGR